MKLGEAVARSDMRVMAEKALAAGPLCDHCLGRLFAEVDTGLSNAQRGRRVREAVGGPPAAPPCPLCDGLFGRLEDWAARAREALAGWEFATLAVASHADPQIAAREEMLWAAAGGELAEPYKQEFNRLLGIRLCETLGCEADLRDPDIIVVADHAAGKVDLDVQPLFVAGRYRKLVRGLPQCRWPEWPTSIQEIVGDPILREVQGEDHFFHGCGREDTDVRCLAGRPFVLEVLRPRRRRPDWAVLAQAINSSGKVEVLDLATCRRGEVARLKALRPEKTYHAVAALGRDVTDAACEGLARLVGTITQRTPTRVLRRRSDLVRRRCVVSLEWRPAAARTLELTVRAQAGTYIKELISGDGGRTTPSVAEVLGIAAQCAELDVVGIHLDAPQSQT
jgi:tRNA pseudouridine synthase 10